MCSIMISWFFLVPVGVPPLAIMISALLQVDLFF